MAKTKSKKRKQIAQADAPIKLAKTSATTTTPPPTDSDGDATSLEPKSLQTVISDEELEIAVDTLKTLASYPNLIKSRACKDLRVAVYDFRQASASDARTFSPPAISFISIGTRTDISTLQLDRTSASSHASHPP